MKNAKRLLEAISENEKLADQFKELKSKEALLQFAEANGFPLSDADLHVLKLVAKAQETQKSGNSFSDEEFVALGGEKGYELGREVGKVIRELAENAGGFLRGTLDEIFKE